MMQKLTMYSELPPALTLIAFWSLHRNCIHPDVIGGDPEYGLQVPGETGKAVGGIIFD